MMRYLSSYSLACLFLLGLLSCSKESEDLSSGDSFVAGLQLCELELIILEGPNGILSAEVDGAQAPISYLWSTGETSSSIEIVSGQEYSVEVSDALGCTESDFLLTDSCGLFSATVVESPTGTYTANVINGIAPYVYVWSNGENTQSITDSTISIVSLSITDATGCMIFYSESSSTTMNCLGFNVELEESPPGTINTLISGGEEPFAFFWNNGQSTSSISVTEGGMYGVVVLDESGCIINVHIQI